MIGTVKWFNADKGYGFIRPDQPSAIDVFVHANKLRACGIEKLPEGARVSYEIGRDERSGRIRAVDITLIEAST